MGLLIVNHYDIVDEKKRELLISEALEIFIRIQETCNDIDICRQAKKYGGNLLYIVKSTHTSD